jgi:EpsI family protein
MQLDRRDLLAGLACAGALGAAEWLRPREKVIFMPPGGKLTDLVPASFGPWLRGGDADIVVPRTEGSLATRLYGDQLARIYHQADLAIAPMMLSIAYGYQQSDALQLHRPESCYPAVGFTIGDVRMVDLPAPGGAIRAVALTARMRDRIEDIVYWSRLGRDFPRSQAEQRRVRFSNALAGEVPDGVLVRASSLRNAPDQPQFSAISGFLGGLVGGLNPAGRRVLLARS